MWASGRHGLQDQSYSVHREWPAGCGPLWKVGEGLRWGGQGSPGRWYFGHWRGALAAAEVVSQEEEEGPSAERWRLPRARSFWNSRSFSNRGRVGTQSNGVRRDCRGLVWGVFVIYTNVESFPGTPELIELEVNYTGRNRRRRRGRRGITRHPGAKRGRAPRSVRCLELIPWEWCDVNQDMK